MWMGMGDVDEEMGMWMGRGDVDRETGQGGEIER